VDLVFRHASDSERFFLKRSGVLILENNMTECSLIMGKAFIIGSKQLKGKQANTRREIKLYREFWFLDFGFALPQQLKHG